MKCQHEFKSQRLEKKVGAERFFFDALTCQKCDLYIWNGEIHQPQLDRWIKENKIRVSVNFRCDSSVDALVRDVASKYGSEGFDVIKALLAIHFKYIKHPKNHTKLITTWRKARSENTKVREFFDKNIEITPKLFWSLKALATHEGMEKNMSEFIQIVLEVMAVQLTENEDFFGLRDDLEAVLIAA